MMCVGQLLFSGVGFAQTFNITDSISQVTWSIEITDSGFVFIGGSQEPLWWSGMDIWAMDDSLNVVGHTDLGEQGVGTFGGWSSSSTTTNDGNFFVTGTYEDTAGISDLYMVKYTASADTIWTKKFRTANILNIGYSSIETEDGGFMIVGSISDSLDAQIGLFKTDSVGNVEWYQDYGNINTPQIGISLLRLPDNGYVVGGQTWETNGIPGYDHFIFRVDSVGNTIWIQQYGDPDHGDGSSHVQIAADGNIVYGGIWAETSDLRGSFYFAKLDVNTGDTIFTKKYGDENLKSIAFSVKQTSDGNFVCSGISEDPANYQFMGLILKIDQDGELLWWRQYTHVVDNDCWFRDVVEMDNGGFLAAGNVFPSGAMNIEQAAWFVMTDEFGCIVPGCHTIGIDEIVVGLDDALKIWPNPNSGTFQLEITFPTELELGSALQLSITNVLGAIVHQQELPSIHAQTLSISQNLPVGIYHVHVSSDARYLSGAKMVVSASN